MNENLLSWHHLVFASSFASGSEGGVHTFGFNTESGALLPVHHHGEGRVFFLTVAPNGETLYGTRWEAGNVIDGFGEIVAWSIAKDGGLRTRGRCSTMGNDSCYVSMDPSGHTLLLANYTGGRIAAFPVGPDGSLGSTPTFIQLTGSGAHPRQAASHPHCFVPGPRCGGISNFAYAADLGSDRIYGYRMNGVTTRLEPLNPPFCMTPSGSGPRHLAFHPRGDRLYSINELSNTVTVYCHDSATGKLATLQTVSTLPQDFTGTSYGADLAIAPDGRFLYATNRGNDSIAIFRIGEDGGLEFYRAVSSGGKGPQNIAVSPDGAWLLCANMAADSIAVFRVDDVTGNLMAARAPIEIKAPSCLVIKNS